MGNLEMVKELVESHSVGVNEVDYTDRTALHAAAAAGHAEIVQYLVEHGADRTIQDSWGITPVGKCVLWTFHLPISMVFMAYSYWFGSRKG
jgi:hypothetical protein